MNSFNVRHTNPRHREAFSVIQDVLMENTALSMNTRLVLGWMLSRPPGWEIQIKYMLDRLGMTENVWRTIKKELMAHSFFTQTRLKNDQGKFIWVQEATDAPLYASGHPRPRKPASKGSCARGYHYSRAKKHTTQEEKQLDLFEAPQETPHAAHPQEQHAKNPETQQPRGQNHPLKSTDGSSMDGKPRIKQYNYKQNNFTHPPPNPTSQTDAAEVPAPQQAPPLDLTVNHELRKVLAIRKTLASAITDQRLADALEASLRFGEQTGNKVRHPLKLLHYLKTLTDEELGDRTYGIKLERRRQKDFAERQIAIAYSPRPLLEADQAAVKNGLQLLERLRTQRHDRQKIDAAMAHEVTRC